MLAMSKCLLLDKYFISYTYLTLNKKKSKQTLIIITKKVIYLNILQANIFVFKIEF